ncbi:MAG: hypothetical protein J1E63_08215 [Muribaculaceae bacterium]|nr:hypothetical protein [Muribaculaceae bacterium]
MKIELTKQQMREQWMARRYGEPCRLASGTVIREHQADVEALAEREMRNWYLELLDTAEARFLCPEEVGNKVMVNDMGDDTVEIVLPVGVRRVIAVRMEGWKREATMVEADSVAARRLLNPFSRATNRSPVAVVTPTGRLRVTAVDGSTTVGSLLVVVDHGEERYVMDDSALGLI